LYIHASSVPYLASFVKSEIIEFLGDRLFVAEGLSGGLGSDHFPIIFDEKKKRPKNFFGPKTKVNNLAINSNFPDIFLGFQENIGYALEAL